MKPTLLILAAGMGSRYGGIKQLDQLGPNGETIMDYSVNDAIAAGYGKVVFVIRKSMENDFVTHIMRKYQHKIPVEYVFQELNALPEGFQVNTQRIKPYGTAHAILVAKDTINEPFTVINADDYYGREAYLKMSNFLQTEQKTELPQFAMVGYQLRNTLSENGSVSRGVCSVNSDNELTQIIEMTHIKKNNGLIYNYLDNNSVIPLPDNTIVSMNFWGFTPLFFDCLNDLFIQFLKEENSNPKSEFVLPTAVNYFLKNQKATIKVLQSNAEWFGVTYQADKEMVMTKLKAIRS